VFPPADRERLLTVDEVAERLNVRVRFVRRLISERRIVFVKVGSYVRISSSDLDDFVRNCRVQMIGSEIRGGYGIASEQKRRSA